MSAEMRVRVWITKYVLTKGIFEVDGEVVEDLYIKVKDESGWGTILYGPKDWHRTKEGAEKRALELIQSRKKALTKELKKLEALEAKYKVVTGDKVEGKT